MANFWDLPQPIREKIYRLHLVQEDPISFSDFRTACGSPTPYLRGKPTRIMPQLLQLCKKTERAAAPIYFGENTFLMNVDNCAPACWWKERLWPRHTKLIRKVIYCWATPYNYGTGYNERFRTLASLKGLDQLTIRVDEQEALEIMLKRHSSIKWHRSLGFGPQLQLQALHFCGIMGLESLRNIRHIEFAPYPPGLPADRYGNSGTMSGGMLAPVVRYGVQQALYGRRYSRKGYLQFLDLPPEVRNTIYKMLLVFPGVLYPRTDKPTSVTHEFPYLRNVDRESIPVPHSALAILQTTRQIHNEAASIFYSQNDLVFSYPAHLQAFTLNLETPRLESVTSVTLFFKDHNEGGLHTMDVTLGLLRRMRGLKKFHLLVEQHMARLYWWNSSQLRQGSPATLHGVAKLFSLRGITDIKVRDLDLEDRVLSVGAYSSHNPDKPGVKVQAQVLKHFNRGLTLAQSGTVVHELYTKRFWFYDTHWPKLGDYECGTSIGCSCGGSERDAGDEEKSDE